MLRSGLVSVTFRDLSPAEIISLSLDCRLEGIEWGGDVHAPHGNIRTAESVRAMCADAGISIPCYGSYFRAGWNDAANPSPTAVIESALALGAPLIRIWAGRQGSAKCPGDARIEVEQAIADFTAEAARHDLRVAFEFHSNTLTDTLESTRQLIEAIDSPNLLTLWQPPLGSTRQDNLLAIQSLGDKLANAHAFAWERGESGTVRLPLADHAEDWTAYLHALNTADRWILLEFVKDNDPRNLQADARTLTSWLEGE